MKLHQKFRLLQTFFIIFLLAGCQRTPVSVIPTAIPPTLSPTVASSATAVPTERSPYPPTPPVIPNLVIRQPDAFLSQPLDGLALDVYKMPRPPIAEELGYQDILRSLGSQSRTSRLPRQGLYYWSTADLALMDADNVALAPFGYRLESIPAGEGQSQWFKLYRGDQLIIDPVTSIRSVSVNGSGTDFMLAVGSTGASKLVTKSSIVDIAFDEKSVSDTGPQYLGDTPMHIEFRNTAKPTPFLTPEIPYVEIGVFKGDQVIETLRYGGKIAGMIIQFWTYDFHWVIEDNDMIVVDGQNLSTLYGYDKAYEFHLLGNRPLFFFEKNGHLGINFDGKETYLPFQAISHYGCCSASLNNPVQMGSLLLFYGSKDKDWYYVELEANP